MNNLDDYLIEQGKAISSKIKNNKPLDLSNAKVAKVKTQQVRRTIIFVCVFLVILSSLVVASTPYMKKIFSSSQGLNLHIAEKEGHIIYPVAEAKDRGITMRITGAVAGNDMVIISAEFEGVHSRDLTQMIHYGVVGVDDPDDRDTMILYDEFDVPHWHINGNGIVNSALELDGGVYKEVYQFECALNKTQKLRLKVREIAGIQGNWDMEFELPYYGTKEYDVNGEFELDDCILFIDKIILDPISTTAHIRYSNADSAGSYHIQFESNQEFDSRYTFLGTYMESTTPVNFQPDGTQFGSYEYLRFTMRPLPMETSTITVKWRKSLENPIQWHEFKIDLKK